MTTQTVVTELPRVRPEGFSGWKMVALAFLAQNCAMGMNIGIYGTIVPSIEHEFATTRTLAATGVSLMTLFLGLSGPLVGALMGRFAIRTLMIGGAILCAIAYALLYFTTNIYALLAIYALVMGPGVAALGVMPASALVGHWFVEGRGKALGIVNTPLFILVFPFVAAFMLSQYGLRSVFITGGVCLVVLIPLLLPLVQRPEDIGQRPLGSSSGEGAAQATAAVGLTMGQLLRVPAFWVATMGVSVLTFAGLMMVTHIVSLALDRGLPLASASLLLGISGVMSVAGPLVFGWLCDRLGPRWAFVINFVGSIATWLALMYVGANLPALIIIALLLGTSAGSTMGLFGASMATWLGRENIGRAMGISYLIQAPFMFGSGPLAGYLRQVTGNYNAAILLCVGAYALLTLVFLVYRPRAIGEPSPA